MGEIAGSIERPAVQGELRIGPEGVVIRPPEVGRYVDRLALGAALRAVVSARDRVVTVPLRAIIPAADAERFGEAAAAARGALAPIALQASGGALTLDQRALGALLKVNAVTEPPATRPVPEAFGAARRIAYVLDVDEAALAAAAEAVAARLDRPPHDAGYKPRANGSLEVVPAEEGARVDRLALAASLRRALLDPSAARSVTVASVAVRPTFATALAERDAANLTRLSFFESYGPPGEAEPIETLVPPGQRFASGAVGPAVATAAAGAALGAGFEVSLADLSWRDDSGHPVLLRVAPTRTSVIAELWGVPADRAVSWGAPDPAGSTVRTVTRGGTVVTRQTVPGPLSPPRPTVSIEPDQE